VSDITNIFSEGFNMQKPYHREFVVLGAVSVSKNEFDKVNLSFKATNGEYKLQIIPPYQIVKPGEIDIGWDDLKEELSIAHTDLVVVHKEPDRYIVVFLQYNEVIAHIRCRDIDGLPLNLE
jgi:hypothetical protein